MSASNFSLPISLLRQHVFCPRIPYFSELLQLNVPAPLWVKQGVDYHQKTQDALLKRIPKKLNLQDEKKHFLPSVRGKGLHGIPDFILEYENEIVVLEFKQRMELLSRATLLQLCGYMIAAEITFQKPAKTGYVLFQSHGKFHEVKRQEELDDSVFDIKSKIEKVLQSQQLPDSSAQMPKCVQCEYLSRCNDRE